MEADWVGRIWTGSTGGVHGCCGGVPAAVGAEKLGEHAQPSEEATGSTLAGDRRRSGAPARLLGGGDGRSCDVAGKKMSPTEKKRKERNGIT